MTVDLARQDLVAGLRGLVRNWRFSLLSVLTLALGTGLTAAMLAVLNGTLWHPLPYADANRLVVAGGPVSRLRCPTGPRVPDGCTLPKSAHFADHR